MRHTTFTAVAALLALAALQGRAAADGTPGAPASWQPRGTVLAGAATTADPPAMRPGVTYRDTIKPGETRFYGITLDARTSTSVSAFAVPPAGARVAFRDGIELKLQGPDGSDCDQSAAHFEDDGDARPIGTAVSRLITGHRLDVCQDADQYTLQVHRTSDGAADPEAWPLELRSFAEPALAPGTAASAAPAVIGGASPTPLITGTPHQASGGTSFDTAAAVRTGIWRDRVPAGATRFYKVPVDWGQQVTVFADFSSAPDGDAGAFVASGVRLTAYSPVRQLVDGGNRSYAGRPVSLDEQLARVAYGNRTAYDSRVAAVRYAGWYYFAVTVHPGVAQAVDGPLPVTLRVEVAGPAQPGPAYDGDARAAGIGVGPHDMASADGAAATAGGGAGHAAALRLVAFAAFGTGTALLLVLAVWSAVARRRATAAV
ncbi:hypothetical protein [Actinacidiphila rubida]|uniref:hypothetical protein n=1 Tax=Actinacidiphila rubida TaxID=310780 RepID=UPI0008496FAC|nr:hypothetical protein [Actinacidiphila rubida]